MVARKCWAHGEVTAAGKATELAETPLQAVAYHHMAEIEIYAGRTITTEISHLKFQDLLHFKKCTKFQHHLPIANRDALPL